MLAEHELADLYLAERLTAPDLRARLDAGMPRGYSVVDLHDVWIGEPALAPQLAAADYRMTLLHVEPRRLEEAAERLLAADETAPGTPQGFEDDSVRLEAVRSISGWGFGSTRRTRPALPP